MENIKNNIDLNTVMCERCGERVEITNNKVKYCDKCAEEIEKNNIKLRVKKFRNKKV